MGNTAPKMPRLGYVLAAKPLSYHLIDADASPAARVICKPLKAKAILDSPPDGLPVCKKCLFKLRALYPE